MSKDGAGDSTTIVVKYLDGYGIHIDHEQACKTIQHLELVIEKNKSVNLTRITNPDDALILHVVDSLLLIPSVIKATETSKRCPKVLDIGTGAGFPGIPLHIVTGCNITLIDSVGKKIKAVDEFINELALDREYVEAIHTRAEELAKERRGQYDLVVARAVAQTNTLVEYATPLLKMGGHLVVTKGNISDDEIKAGITAAKICGLKLVSRETLELPEDKGHREVICFEKVKGPSIKLPRNTGMAQHHPLGSK